MFRLAQHGGCPRLARGSLTFAAPYGATFLILFFIFHSPAAKPPVSGKWKRFS